MKYFHRTHQPPVIVLAQSEQFFGGWLAPTEETPSRRRFRSAIGHVSVTAAPDGGHYTLVTVDSLREVYATSHPRAR